MRRHAARLTLGAGIVQALAFAMPALADTCPNLAWTVVQTRWAGQREAPDAFKSVEHILEDVDGGMRRMDAFVRAGCDHARLVSLLDCTQTDDGLPAGSAIRRTGKTAANESELRALFATCWERR